MDDYCPPPQRCVRCRVIVPARVAGDTCTRCAFRAIVRYRKDLEGAQTRKRKLAQQAAVRRLRRFRFKKKENTSGK